MKKSARLHSLSAAYRYIYIYDLDTCGYPNKCYNYVDNNEDGHEHD